MPGSRRNATLELAAPVICYQAFLLGSGKDGVRHKHLWDRGSNPIRKVIDPNLLQKSYDELDHEYDELEKKIEERKAEDDGARQIIEESFRTVVRFMRGAGHEDDEVEVPETNVSIAEMLKAEMIAWQERMEQQRQILFGRMPEMFEQINKSADRDDSRKHWMETHTNKATGESFEEIYQRDIVAMRGRDEDIVRRAEQMAGMKSDNGMQKE